MMNFQPFSSNQIYLLPCREPDAFSLTHNFALHALLDLHTILLLFNSGFVLVIFIEEMIKSTYGDLEFTRSMNVALLRLGYVCTRR